MIIDPLDYTRGVGDDDVSFLEKMKALEGEMDFVTIKTPNLVIKTTNPEKYSSYKGEWTFSVKSNKTIEIPPKKGSVVSKEKGIMTIKTTDYKNYKTIIDNL